MDSWLELACKSFAFKGVLDALPKDVPFIRELRIQTDKLTRMLLSPPWKSEPLSADRRLEELTIGEDGVIRVSSRSPKHERSVKKYNKAKGKYAAKVGEQAKKVKKLADQSFKQWFRHTGQITTNAEFQKWKAKFDGAIKESAERMQNQINSGAVKQMAQHPSKPFGRIGRK